MESIEQMIARLCPNGVEYVKIGDICTVGTGSGNRQDASENGQYPFFVRSKDILRNDKYEFDEEAILIPGEGGIGDIFHYYKGRYALHQRTYRIHPISDAIRKKFLYYYMYANFKKFILMKAVSATVTSIRKPMIETFEIPLPPLEVQNSIVEILDKMTTLTAELEAELEARKQQYEYYRNKLLTFNINGGGIDNVTWKKISEVCEIKRGIRVIKKELQETGDIPVYQNSLIPLGYKEISNTPSDITFVISAGAAGEIGYSNIPFWAADDCLTIKGSSIIDNKYIFYFLKNNETKIKSKVRRASVPRLSRNIIDDFIIPLPPLSEQNRIVSILDRFEALTTDLQNGLPAEIEARRQQYEYYRNKLLTFEKSA